MKPKHERDLMKQILWMHELWGDPEPNRELASMALNRLFAIAKEIDPGGMQKAFRRGIEAARKDAR